MKLRGQLVAVSELSAGDRQAMFELMDRHYAGVTRSVFDADLAEKQWVIQILEPDTGALCGFSTQMVLNTEVEGRPVKALFSGDTIIDRDRWGDQALTQVWGRFALSLAEKWPDAELYWFLISQGYKTYRFLPIFFHEFYPRHDQATPDRAQSVMHALARMKFPSHYDSDAGVIRSQPGQYHLREGVADLTSERLLDPHVQFFNACNPGHTKGDELCCLAALSPENFTAAAYRVMGLDAPAKS